MLQTKNEGQVNEGLCVGVLIVLIHMIVTFYRLYLSYCELVMCSRVYSFFENEIQCIFFCPSSKTGAETCIHYA